MISFKSRTYDNENKLGDLALLQIFFPTRMHNEQYANGIYLLNALDSSGPETLNYYLNCIVI